MFIHLVHLVYITHVSFANVKIITYLSCIVDEMMYK